MQIALEDRTLISGEFVLRAVQRFDLTPIPSTLEAVLRADDSERGQFDEGAVLLAGTAMDRYRIVKSRRATSEWLQGPSDPGRSVEVTALLDGVAGVATPRSTAVVKQGRSMGEVYRACGATARVAADIPVPLFACYCGGIPTVSIAQVLQEEAAAVVWGLDQALSFKRLVDLFAARPVEALDTDTTMAVESAFLEGHEIPVGLSTAADGSVIVAPRQTPRSVVFLPRSNQRVLGNIGRCLKVRRVLRGSYAGHVRAGDAFDIAGVRYVVATVAHEWSTGSGGGSSTQASHVWLAQLAD